MVPNMYLWSPNTASMKTWLTISLSTFIVSATMAQDPLPYHQIPDYPKEYTAGNVAARVVDGLGYRYYWATDGLSEEDLAYRPSPDARSTGETIDHLWNLSSTIFTTARKGVNVRPFASRELNFEQKRAETLRNFAQASEMLKGTQAGDLEKSLIVFQRGESRSEFPFWNLLNGPIADAIYHVGQVVSFRRSSGNPMQSGVNVFMGRTR